MNCNYELLKEIPKNINNYVIEEEICKIKFGIIVSAIHKITEEKIAIKILSKNLLKNNIKQLTLINNEISSLKLLHHKNIIQLYEIIESEFHIYIITELCIGESLNNLIKSKKKLSEKESKYIFNQIINGMYYMNKMKICHRNINSNNIIITKNNIVKIIDFKYSFYYNSLTNILIDKIENKNYSSPEMIEGKEYNCELCDVWSCGVLLYYMLTGNLPFNTLNTNNYTYNFNLFLSENSLSLIKSIIEVDINKRFTFNDIILSSWLSKNNNINVIDGINIFEMKFPVDEKILHLCELYGYNKNLVSFGMKNNLYNENTVLYKLLVQKIVNLGFESLSDFNSNMFNEYIQDSSNYFNYEEIENKIENYYNINQKRNEDIYNQRKNIENTYEELMNSLLEVEKEYNKFILNNPISEENISMLINNNNIINNNEVKNVKKITPDYINTNSKKSSKKKFNSFTKNCLFINKLEIDISDFDKQLFSQKKKLKENKNKKEKEKEKKENSLTNIEEIDFSKDEILKLTIDENKKNKEEDEICNIEIIDIKYPKKEIENIKQLKRKLTEKKMYDLKRSKKNLKNKMTLKKFDYLKNKNKSTKDINIINSPSFKKKKSILENKNTSKKKSISKSRNTLKYISSFSNIINTTKNKTNKEIILNSKNTYYENKKVKTEKRLLNNKNKLYINSIFTLSNKEKYDENISKILSSSKEKFKINSERKIIKKRLFSSFCNKNLISDFSIDINKSEENKNRKINSSEKNINKKNSLLKKSKFKSSSQNKIEECKSYKFNKILIPRKYKGPIDLLLISNKNINETIDFIRMKLKENKFYCMRLSKFQFKCVKNIINFLIEIVEIENNIFYFLLKIKSGAERINIRNIFV